MFEGYKSFGVIREKLILVVLSFFISLFPLVSLAMMASASGSAAAAAVESPQDRFMSALNDQSVDDAKKKEIMEAALKAGAEINDWTVSFSSLPSVEVVEFLLDHGLDKDQCLRMILTCSIDSKQIVQKQQLIKYILKKGGNIKNIHSFVVLPKVEVIEFLLIEKIVGVDECLEMVVDCQNIDDQQQHLDLLKLLFNKHHANVNKMHGFSSLPSIGVVDLLISQGLDVSKCLGWVVNCSNVRDPLRQMAAVKHVVKKHGAKKKIVFERDYWNSKLPPIELVEYLLHNKLLDPTQFLNYIFGCSCTASGIAAKKNLINLAVKFGVQLNQVESQELRGALTKGVDFQDTNQYILTERLVSFFTIAAQRYPSNVDFASLTKSFHDMPGHCMGLTTLWLIGMYKQFNQEPYRVTVDVDQQLQPQATVKIQPEQNNDWFTMLTKTIASWDGHAIFSKEICDEIVRFAKQVDWLQRLAVITNRGEYLVNNDVVQKVAMVDDLKIAGKKLKKKYAATTMVNSTNQEAVTAFLKQAVHDDELVFMLYRNHATGLYKHRETYFFYDPDSGGVYQSTSLADMTKIIFRKRRHKDCTVMGVMVFGYDDNSYTYPNPTGFLSRFSDTYNLFKQARLSISVGCLEALRFCLNSDLMVQEMMGDLLVKAASDNKPDMVSELLNRKVDPRELRSYQDFFAWKVTTLTALQLAEKHGLRKVLSCFHAEPTERKEEKSGF